MKNQSKKKSNVYCSECGFILEGHKNLFGKICPRCDSYIPTDYEMPIVQNNKFAKALMLKKLRDYLAKKYNGDNNANFQ